MRLVQSAGLWIRFWDSLQASKSPQKPNNSNVINMHVCLLYAAYHVHNIYCIKVLSSIQLCLALKLTGLMASSLSRAGDHGIFGHPKPAVQACRIPRIFQGFWAILSFQNLSESFRIFQIISFLRFQHVRLDHPEQMFSIRGWSFNASVPLPLSSDLSFRPDQEASHYVDGDSTVTAPSSSVNVFVSKNRLKWLPRKWLRQADCAKPRAKRRLDCSVA